MTVAREALDRTDVLRKALWASVVFNLGGAIMFAFPASVGRLAGLPTPVPRLYSAALVLFVLLFGGAYAWLASQTRIDRPMVALAAIGKAGFFFVCVTFWLLGDLPVRGVVAVSGDMAFALVFAWWLFGS